MYPLRTLPTLNKSWWELLLEALFGVLIVVMVIFALRGIARADTANELPVDADLVVGVMTVPMAKAVTEYRDAIHAEWLVWFTHLNGPWIAPVVASAPHSHPTPTYTPPPADVESWRGLIERYFPANRVDEALKVVWCESRGDPSAKNPESTASGLFQILRGWWSGDWSTAIGPFDPFDPESNVAAASKIAGGTNYWSDWAASRACHGL